MREAQQLIEESKPRIDVLARGFLRVVEGESVLVVVSAAMNVIGARVGTEGGPWPLLHDFRGLSGSRAARRDGAGQPCRRKSHARH
jgi:hypothetical protein